MSNLTIFVDRLITDGKYKTICLVYDEAFIKDTDFVSQLVDLSQGKYAMFIMKHEYPKVLAPVMKKHRRESGILQVLMLNYGEDGKKRLRNLMSSQNILYNTQNVVLLITMQSNERREEIWDFFNGLPATQTSHIPYINISVVFYQTQTQMSMKMANASRKSMEIFVLNYKTQEIVEPQEIDVENCDGFRNDQVNECNLHEKIFGQISRKTLLAVHSLTTSMKTATTESILHGNNTLVNFGQARFYLTNFLVRNLRFKDFVFQNIFRHSYIKLARGRYYEYSESYMCHTSNEKTYAELYNVVTLLPRRAAFKRFVTVGLTKKSWNKNRRLIDCYYCSAHSIYIYTPLDFSKDRKFHAK